jgi:polyisoprenyl-phosphate glycosyltransferase
MERLKLPWIVIVTPVLNDWAPFQRLLDELDKNLEGHCSRLTVIAVNDGSAIAPPNRIERTYKTIDSVEILDLAVNLGHQRAIAVGLAHANRYRMDCVVVMDSDGEDKPEDVVTLARLFAVDPSPIHVVERGRRSESFGFRFFYFFYKRAFLLGTGARIAHGNFCLIPSRSLHGLLHSANTWNNLAASIVRSRLPYRPCKLDRGVRYEGQSHMSFTSLLLHGMSALSVYLDVVTARLLIGSGVMLALLVVSMLLVIGVRFFTDLAIPGWTTAAAGIITIVILQIVLLASSVLFTLLYNRGQMLAVPAKMAETYVMAARTIYGAGPREKLASGIGQDRP